MDISRYSVTELYSLSMKQNFSQLWQSIAQVKEMTALFSASA